MSGGMSGGAAGTDTGFDLTTKGQIHGYSTNQIAINVGTDNQILIADSGVASGISYQNNDQSIICACSDEDSDLVIGDDKLQIRVPYDFTLTGIKANVNVAPVGSDIHVQVQADGVDIMSGVGITIDVSELTSLTSTTLPTLTTTALNNDQILSFDLDQIGSGTAGQGLKVCLIGFRRFV